MTAPTVLEKVRMCVAEAGHDPHDVWLDPTDLDIDGTPFILFEPTVPKSVMWRACEIAGVDAEPICFTCDQEAFENDGQVGLSHILACLADRRLVLDCGRDR